LFAVSGAGGKACGGAGGVGRGISKKFFFEKKNQKTFTYEASALTTTRTTEVNVFCFFFQKRSPCFLTAPHAKPPFKEQAALRWHPSP
jgi:hypothetical protein